MTGPKRDRREALAGLACAYAGLVWGVFWMPLRALDAGGIGGAWATVFYYAVPFALVLPVAIVRFPRMLAGGRRLQLTGLVAGTSMVLYADAVLHTEVIRAMLLYYLTPIWSFALARIWLKEKISGSRMAAIVLGLCGAAIIFGIDAGMPWPRNSGDWMGLASGIVWAVAAVLMRADEETAAIDYAVVYFAWGTVVAIIVAMLTLSGGQPLPSMQNIIDNAFWSVPVVAVLVIPAVYAMMWGAPLLNPGVVGLLFMTEISVGAVTAAIWAGEPVGMREIVGVIVITAAGLTEIAAASFDNMRARIAARGRNAA